MREYYQALGRPVPEELQRIWQFHEVGRASAGNREDWPASGLTLTEAEALAAWRLGRLPVVAEWAFATGGAVGYRFPWGDTFRGYLCNTDELSLGRPTAVGTFDAGGYSSGHAFCFDLIGNLAELVAVPEPERSPWEGGPEEPEAPPADPGRTTWLAVGWHYLHRYRQGENPLEDGALGPILPGDRECTVGMRVATDPETFLTALLGRGAAADAADRATVEPFLVAYRELFAPALARLAPAARDLETLRWLCRVLDVSPPR